MLVKVSTLREEISRNAGRIRSRIVLEKLSQVSDLYQRKMSRTDYKTMTEEDYDRASIIDAALELNGTRLRNLRFIARDLEERDWREAREKRGRNTKNTKFC